MTAGDLDNFREMFPRAVGLQVLIAGFIIVTFDSIISDVEEAYENFGPLELGSLRVFFDLNRYECTTSVESGVELSVEANKEYSTRAGSLA